MSAEIPSVRLVPGYCGLCIARCGTVATVTDGRFTRLDPDPTHPTGAAICAKGRAAPELVYHKDRLTRPPPPCAASPNSMDLKPWPSANRRPRQRLSRIPPALSED